tara:strand:+ start:1221 stop:1592 length:372 start_codon:yes stop_codon:yes gene_type:complete
MANTIPHLSQNITKKIVQTQLDLVTQVNETHVDGAVEIVGYLRNGKGAKIRISNLECIEDNDVEDWIYCCEKNDSLHVNYTANFGDGNITLDVEYKSDNAIQYCEWLKYPLILASLSIALQFL